jgi:hypothetical protein
MAEIILSNSKSLCNTYEWFYLTRRRVLMSMSFPSMAEIQLGYLRLVSAAAAAAPASPCVNLEN